MQIAWRDVDNRKGWPCCLMCGKKAPSFTAWSDYFFVAPEDGGLPIPENGLTICPDCREKYERGPYKGMTTMFFQAHLGVTWLQLHERMNKQC